MKPDDKRNNTEEGGNLDCDDKIKDIAKRIKESGDGNVELPPDEKRMKMAAQDSGADTVISRLPRGYDTILSTWFKDGEELSLGEWQKMAISRFFYRGPKILVLDEPTSSMDFRSERKLLERLRESARGRPIIIISHRPSAVQAADRIYLLENGRTVEDGTHEELLRLNGKYALLFNSRD